MAEQDFDEARDKFTRALAYFEGANDPAAAAIVRNNLGIVERRDPAGDKALSEQHLQAALRLRRELGDRRGIAETLNNLGVLAHVQDDLDAARSYYAETLEHEQALHHIHGAAIVLCNLGEIADAKNEHEPACRLFAAAEHLFDAVKSVHAAYAADLLAGAAAKIENGAALAASLRQSARSLSPEELIARAMKDELLSEDAFPNSEATG